MSNSPEELQLVDFKAEQENLMTTARRASAQRAGNTLYRGDGLRQTMVALLAGAEMTEHESPIEAFLHVIQGRVTIHGDDRKWTIEAGQLLPIPPEKHSVIAEEDSVFTLTVLRTVAAQRA